MKSSKDKSEFIKFLQEAPFISYAAQKVGFARSTIYRLMKDDIKFKKDVEKAQKEGRLALIDLAEMMLVKNIKKGDMRAIVYFLQHNDPRYIPKRTVYIEPERKLKPGEACDKCGRENIEDMSQAERKHYTEKALVEIGFNKEEKENVISHLFPRNDDNRPIFPEDVE